MAEGSDTRAYARSPRGPGFLTVRPDQIRALLEKGVNEDEIKRLLVATGSWSESGASEIVSFLNAPQLTAGQHLLWRL